MKGNIIIYINVFGDADLKYVTENLKKALCNGKEQIYVIVSWSNPSSNALKKLSKLKGELNDYFGQGVRFLEKLYGGEYFRLMAGARVTAMPSIVPESFGIVAVSLSALEFPWRARGSAAFPRLWINTALPEKVAEVAAKVLEMRYDREEMRLYARKKFRAENVERLINIFNEVTAWLGFRLLLLFTSVMPILTRL